MDLCRFIGCQTSMDKFISQLKPGEKSCSVKTSCIMRARSEGRIQTVLISVDMNLRRVSALRRV